MGENRSYNDSPTFIPARLESSVHSSIPGNGNKGPVADAKDIYDINHDKWQKDINEEVEAVPAEIERIDGELEDRYTKEETYNKTEVDAKESGLQGQINTIKGGSTKSIATIDNEINGNDGIDERLSTVEELAQISIDGGTIGIATASDFDNPTPEQEAKVTTVGAIIGITDTVPTKDSDKLVNSGGVYNSVPEIDLVVSENLHDNTSDVVGAINSNGVVNSDSRFKTTDYIEVDSSKVYSVGTIIANLIEPVVAAAITFFDANKEPIGYTTDKPYIEPVVNSAYMRCSVLSGYSNKLQIIENKFEAESIPYGESKIVSEDSIPEIDGKKIKDDSVDIEKLSIKDVSIGKNIFNKNDSGNLDGYYIRANGAVAENSIYFTSHFIRIDPSKSYSFSNNGIALSVRFAVLYDNNKLFKENIQNTTVIPPTTGAGFLRICTTLNNKGTLQVEEGTTVSSYSEYTKIITIKEQYIPQIPVVVPDNSISLRKIAKSNPISTILGVDRESSEGSIASNATLSIDNSPVYIKRFGKMSFKADITTFGEFYIGKGYQSRSGRYIKIDATNITPISCDFSGSEILGTPVPHGLIISDFVFVVVGVEDAAACVYIMSKGGSFKTINIGGNWANAVGTPFVKSNGLVASASKLSVAYSELLKKIWIVGDSYLSLYDPARWPYHVEDLGFKTFLVDALSGGASQVYDDALICLSMGSPKYLLWCLGMNYASDTDANTPDSTWLSEVETIMELCEERGLTLVLCTIPNTATKNHTGKNKYIKDSGLRYVDMAKAVGAETFVSGTNTWYEGYCADGTHPTEIGAKALASQCLSDFSEIMEY